MKLRSTLFTSALGAFVALASCSDDTSKKVPPGSGEAGEAGAPIEGGSGGKSGSGGVGGRGGSASIAGAANGGTAGMDIGPNALGGAAGEDPIGSAGVGAGGSGGPAPALLFTVDSGAVGLGNDAVATSTRRASTLFGSITPSPDPDTGSNEVRITGAELGLAVGDALTSFAVVQAVPANPVYWFSVGPNEGGEGESPTRLSFSSAANEALGDVYFSDATESYRNLGEGNDTLGYNGLVADEQSLGLSPDTTSRSPSTHEDNLTGVGALPSGLTPSELYFTVGPDSVGVAGSAVEATPVNERACTVFHSNLSGSNTVAYHCSDLGLSAGSQITGLVLYGRTAPAQALFTVASGSTGDSLPVTAPGLTSSIYASPLDGTNTLQVNGHSLGLLDSDALDALAVVDQAPAAYAYADSCGATEWPFSAGGASIDSVNSAHELGRDSIVFQGQLAGSTTLDAIGVYKLSTCTFVASMTYPTGTLNGNSWVPIPGTGWTEATPLANLEFWQLADDATGLQRYDATGKLLASYPIDNITPGTVDAVRLDWDLINDDFYAEINPHADNLAYGRLQFFRPPATRPDGTHLVPFISTLPHPCAFAPEFSGVDDNGNAIYAQRDSVSAYRVCAFSTSGELAGLPFTWQLRSPADLAVLKPGIGFFAINTGDGLSINRYTPR